MNCEECKERVFELIEREAVDPEGVRAILADCPDCRAEFDAMKAALVLAEQLPVEEPPPDIDAAILRKAALRTENAAHKPATELAQEATVVPLRKRFLQTPPWAMAAVALLAVGLGVWSIPRGVQLESEADSGVSEAEEAVPFAEAPGDDALGGGLAPTEAFGAAQVSDEAKVAALNEVRAPAPVARGRPAKGAARPARRELPRAKKRLDALAKQSASGAVPESAAASAPEAPAQVQADDRATARAAAPVAAKGEAAAERSVQGVAVAADADFADEEAEDRGAKSAEAGDCKAKVAAFERRLSGDKGYEPGPEEELAIGRCYQTLGDTAKARTWLQRAATDPATKRRAQKALRSLPAN